MRQFVMYSRMKQIALRVGTFMQLEVSCLKNNFLKTVLIYVIECFAQALASTLNEEEIADLRDQFDAIDVDKNGSISLEEMRQVLNF